MFSIKIVEEKDRPKELGKAKSNEIGVTVYLLIQLIKLLYITLKIVIVNSDFYILQSIIKLKKLGVCALVLIKKSRFQLKDVPGNVIENKLKEVLIGEIAAIKDEIDNIDYFYS